LDPALLAPELRVRNWRPGDRYWPAQTKSPRKVKELLQGLHLGSGKPGWPVVESDGEIVWIPGFAPAARFRARGEKGSAVVIEEVTVGNSSDHGPQD
jgi:tRNA(Ile)-lysidine synthetase-like protein